MEATQFLNDELGHAERQLARVRRIAAQMEQQLLDQGISEVEGCEKLAQSKAYRQLRRDEVVFHQMWLRTHRHLQRLTPEPAVPQPSPVDVLLAELERSPKPQPYRKPPTPGPNQPCSCGSNIKYKKCCGNPLRQQPARAA